MKILKELKKSEFIIYAIALMLVTAGYFSYTTNLEESVETYAEENQILGEETNTTEDDSNIGDATLVNSEDVVDENTMIDTSIAETEDTESSANNIDDTDNDDETMIDTADTNDNSELDNTTDTSSTTESTNDSDDYFASSKLDRDTNFASMISTYTAMIENDNVSETQKGVAMQEITKINETKSAIMICENLISTKGFKNCVIFINNDSVNVVVQKDGGLTKDGVAQIQNIISREIGTKIENIHITEK